MDGASPQHDLRRPLEELAGRFAEGDDRDSQRRWLQASTMFSRSSRR